MSATVLAIADLKHKMLQVQIFVKGRCNFSDNLRIMSHFNIFSEAGEGSLTSETNQYVSCCLLSLYKMKSKDWTVLNHALINCTLYIGNKGALSQIIMKGNLNHVASLSQSSIKCSYFILGVILKCNFKWNLDKILPRPEVPQTNQLKRTRYYIAF